MKYTSPTDKFLKYGMCQRSEKWPNYLELGFTQAHIPELIRMMTDPKLLWAEQNSLEVWAPVHAWRTLGQLGAKEAIGPLMSLFTELSDDDWAGTELPQVMSLIGGEAMNPLAEYLCDSSQKEFSRVIAAQSLEAIGNRNAPLKEECISVLTRYLEDVSRDTPALNALVISYLIDLNATGSIQAIRKAFQKKCVDIAVAGDVEDVEMSLGLRHSRNTPRPDYHAGLFKS